MRAAIRDLGNDTLARNAAREAAELLAAELTNKGYKEDIDSIRYIEYFNLRRLC